MKFEMDNRFMLVVSSRVLFDLREENEVFNTRGKEAFARLQRQRRNRPPRPGVAFAFVQKFMNLNRMTADGERAVETVVVSHSDYESGTRIFRALAHYGLNDVCAGAFTDGRDVLPDVRAFRANLFLTANKDDARRAVAQGIAAGVMYERQGWAADMSKPELKIAYDFDGVLADDSSEQVTHHLGLDAFVAHEAKKLGRPLQPGPIRGVLQAFNALKAQGLPIRESLLTARVFPASDRCRVTLAKWGLRPDEGRFVGGVDKTPFALSFGADLFLEDSPNRVEQCAPHVAVGHVLYGVKNQPK